MIFVQRATLKMKDSKTTPVLCVLASMELSWGLSLLERCPDYGGVLISECVVLCTGFNGVELSIGEVSSIGSVLVMEVSSFQRVLCYVQASME